MRIQSLGDYFGISEEVLGEKWIFNRFIGKDTNLYIDPFLFDQSTIPEFIGARNQIKNHFWKVIKLLKANSIRTLKEAQNLLTFKEVKWVWLWYGAETDNGNSVWPTLAKQLIKSWREIVDMWIADPEMFEILWLFEEGFWADRLSDIVVNILRQNFYDYTNRLTNELWITKTKEYKIWNWKTIKLPYIKETKSHIIFVPKFVLKELPTAHNRDSISYVAAENETLRNKLNEIIWKTRKADIKKAKKSDIKRAVVFDVENIKWLISYYKKKQKLSYDFEIDNKWEIKRYKIWKEISADNPLKLSLSELTIDEMSKVVRKIIHKVQQAIEYNWANMFLYDKNKKVKSEKFFQCLFLIIAQNYCLANNIDISPESNKWRWPVDFKFSQWNCKITVEIKKDTNDVVHGIEKQLPIYEKSEESQKSIYLVFRTTKEWKQIDKLKKFQEDMEKKGKKIPEHYIIDARLQESASNV